MIKTDSYRLYQGDCLTILPKIPDKKIKCLCCDPPYGIDFQSHRRKTTEYFEKIANDKKPFIDFIPLVLPKLSDSGCGFIFTRWDVQQVFIDELKKYGVIVKNILIWNKGVHSMGDLKQSFGSTYESIIFFANEKFSFTLKRPQDIIYVNRIHPDKLVHPNEKPVKLIEILLNYVTKPNDWVLDCFMGSGSCGIACMNTKRRFCGIEYNKDYFKLSTDRIKEASTSLFANI